LSATNREHTVGRSFARTHYRSILLPLNPCGQAIRSASARPKLAAISWAAAASRAVH